MRSVLLAQLRLLAWIERARAGEHHAKPQLLLHRATCSSRGLWRARLEIALAMAIRPVPLPPASPRSAASALIVHCTSKTAEALAVLEKLVDETIPVRGLVRGRWAMVSALLALGSPVRMVKTLARAARLAERCSRGRSRWLRDRTILLLRQSLLAEPALRQTSPAFLLCVSDLSASRMALAAAANRAGIPVVYVQQGHEIKPPMFAIDAAMVLNDRGFEAVRMTLKPNGFISFYELDEGGPSPRPAVVRIDPVGEPHVVGICLNNFVAVESLPTVIAMLERRFASAHIHVRPHPNQRGELPLAGTRATIASAQEPLEAFCRACDLLVCANTTAAIRALTYGRPVLHVTGLDRFPYDSVGHVAAGAVFGVPGGITGIAALNIADIDEFYARPRWAKQFTAALGGTTLRSSADPSERLAQWLRQRLTRGLAASPHSTVLAEAGGSGLTVPLSHKAQ
jgi:hypothetical protein